MIKFDARANIPAGEYHIGYKTKTTVTALNNGGIESIQSKETQDNGTIDAENLDKIYGTGIILAGQVNRKAEAAVTDGSDLDFGFNASIHPPSMR